MAPVPSLALELDAKTAWLRRPDACFWRNRDLQGGRQQCLLAGGGKTDLNGRHAGAKPTFKHVS